jgi:putative oxidoreductase
MTYQTTATLFISAIRAAEARLTDWLARYSVDLLRVSLGLVFLGFGALKFFPGLSPAQELTGRTIEILTFGLVPHQVALPMVATIETAIGLLLVTGLWLRAGIALLIMAMIGILSPLVLLSDELFRGRLYAPTLEGQYVLKDVVLLAGGLVVAARALGARLVPERSPTSSWRSGQASRGMRSERDATRSRG